MDSLEFQQRAETARRKSKLDWYEKELTKRWASFVQIFRELRDDPTKPYLATHDNFEHYCEDRWRMSPRRVQQLLAADSIKAMLLHDAPSEIRAEVQTMNERQLREVSITPVEKRVEVLQKAKAIAGPKKITAKIISEARGVVLDAETGKSETIQKTCPTCGRPLTTSR